MPPAGGELRRSIGVLTHQPMLYEELSPLENLQFFAKLYAVVDAGPRIETLLRQIGLGLRRVRPGPIIAFALLLFKRLLQSPVGAASCLPRRRR